MSEIRVFYRSSDLVAIVKPAGIPSAPDPSGDPDAMSMTAALLRSLGEEDGLWLVHRLDRTVAGLLAFARTQAAAARLSAMIADRRTGKEYLAVAEGAPAAGTYRDLLYKDAAQGKAFVVSSPRRGVKDAVLEAFPLASVSYGGGLLTLVSVRLMTGRFHQIRAQFAARGTPLLGDKKYGARLGGARLPALFSARLLFPCEPPVDLRALPDLSAFPWNLFEKENYPCVPSSD